MGFLFKSAIGLGAVYFAMFGQAPRSEGVGAAASLCAGAASQRLAGDASLSAQASAAGCAVAAVSLAQQTRAAAPPLAGPPPQQAKPHFGALTEADLAEPWFGPVRAPRKAARRG